MTWVGVISSSVDKDSTTFLVVLPVNLKRYDIFFWEQLFPITIHAQCGISMVHSIRQLLFPVKFCTKETLYDTKLDIVLKETLWKRFENLCKFEETYILSSIQTAKSSVNGIYKFLGFLFDIFLFSFFVLFIYFFFFEICISSFCFIYLFFKHCPLRISSSVDSIMVPITWFYENGSLTIGIIVPVLNNLMHENDLPIINNLSQAGQYLSINWQKG